MSTLQSVDSRFGLAQYTSARVNTLFPSATSVNSIKAPFHSSSSSTTSTIAAQRVVSDMNAESTQQPTRHSGSKRDHDRAAATDNLNEVAGSNVDPNANGPVQKKKKITYALPHQNMEEGHFYVVLGEDVDVSTARFKILSLLGEGTFGKVVEAWDRKRKEYCAIKIVRNVPKYTRDAQVEIRYMEKVRTADPQDNFCFMKISRYFQNDSGHMCIVMPKYGPCLLDFLQKNGPFQPRYLAEIIYQAGVGLDYFHSELRLMHTDLKPENMLLESAASQQDAVTGKHVPVLPCKIRFCDLGGCCDERHSKHAIVSTRHYRSPEVVLGLGWMFSTDMWSMGCIIYELVTGRLLYDTHDNLEHLHLMEKTLSRIPSDWSKSCMDDAKPLFSNGVLKSVTDPKSVARVARARPVREVVMDEQLRDLICGLLHYDRSKRYTARQMAIHPFVQKYYPESLNDPFHPMNRTNMPPMPTM